MGATTRRAVACLGLSLGLPACNACDPLPEPTLSPCADAAPTIQEVADDAATPAWDDKRAERHACQFGPGSLTTESVGALPHGTELPFDHVVILMLENRSFDHFLAELPGADVRTSGVNLDSHGIPIPQAVEQQFCADGDVNHEWEKVHAQWHFGQMDGFVVTNHDSPEPMRYFTRDQLPYFYWLAETFATSERHFSSLLGPTWPNRYFLWPAPPGAEPPRPTKETGSRSSRRRYRPCPSSIVWSTRACRCACIPTTACRSPR